MFGPLDWIFLQLDGDYVENCNKIARVTGCLGWLACYISSLMHIGHRTVYYRDRCDHADGWRNQTRLKAYC